MKVHRNLVEQVVGVLQDVFAGGVPAERAVDGCLKAQGKWGSRDRRMFAESVYELVRWWRLYWHLADLPEAEFFLPEAITAGRVWRVWGVYWLDRGRELPAFEELAGLNLAAVTARRAAIPSAAVGASIPDWLDYRGEAELDREWRPLIEALNQPAEVFLRANTLRNSRAQLRQILAAEDIATEEVPAVPDALRLPNRRNLATSPAYRQGRFEIQDAASQQIAPLLRAQPGQVVIDACAGAGGKTLHLAALLQNRGRIIALDLHRSRLEELKSRAMRNGVTIVEAQPIMNPDVIARFAGVADAVLLDVPCSGLGALRRKPETKWRLTHDELDRLLALQHQILDDYSVMAKPGGTLVYATCSVLPSENQRQVHAFIARHHGTWVLDEERHWRPDREGFDGFYAARLVRRAA